MKRLKPLLILRINGKELTRREEQICLLIVQAMSNRGIAQELQISVGTVKVYVSRLYQKLGFVHTHSATHDWRIKLAIMVYEELRLQDQIKSQMRLAL